MRHIILPIAALLISNVAFASDLACSSTKDPKKRLACYDQMAATIDACQSQKDQLDRLVCFDDLSSAIQMALTGKTAPAASAPTQAQPSTATAVTATAPALVTEAATVTPESEFGAKKTTQHQIDAITAKVNKVSADPYKKLILTLDNGQRWKQTESGRVKVKVGDTVTIKRASFGSFLLSLEGTNRTSRVKRL